MTTAQLLSAMRSVGVPGRRTQVLDVQYNDFKPNDTSNYDGLVQDRIYGGAWPMNRGRTSWSIVKRGGPSESAILEVTDVKMLQTYLNKWHTIVFFNPTSETFGHYMYISPNLELFDSYGGRPMAYDLPESIIRCVGDRCGLIRQHPDYNTCGLYCAYFASRGLSGLHQVSIPSLPTGTWSARLSPTSRVKQISAVLESDGGRRENRLLQNEDVVAKLWY